ncbi:MAG: neutral/alkaline non-lysosomal ceramidase N-terminal domain-containing protein, partial [Eubacteriales bacterium]
MANFKAGAGREIITPEIGARLYGYTLDVFSKSVNDDLTATAIAFEYGNERTVLISATVCLINTELCDEIRDEVGLATGIPAAKIILSATHTHSGPCTAGNTGWGPLDREYCDNIFIPKIIKATKTAVANLEPALLGIGSVKSEIGINRRQLNKDNLVSLGQNPWGCYDPNLTVLSFKNTAGKPVANIIHYGAHCTAAGKNTEITRDWAGAMIDRLDAESGTVTAFFNGAQGDVGPRLSNGQTVGNIDYVKEHGKLAAEDAAKAYNNIDEYGEADLCCVTGEIKLPYAAIMPLEEARQKLAAFKGDEKINLSGRTFEYLNEVVKAHESGISGEKNFSFAQTIIKIGPVVFIPFSFEFFSEISLRLRQYSAYKYTLCLGCTNGNNGYLPTQDQLCGGGYEIDVFLTSGVLTLAQDSDYNIITENLR